MSVRSSQPPLRPRRLTRIVSLLIILCCIPSDAFDQPYAQPDRAPSPAECSQRFVETATVHQAYADWPGKGRIAAPGIYHTLRVTTDARTGWPVEVELALAEPLLVHSHGARGDRPPRIALTFDDGPSGRYTPQILDIFAEHGGRCTFFTLGALVGSHKQILRRAEQEGHEIAMHSWWHASYTGLSDDGIRADISRCRSALEGVAKRPVRWIRPPYGAVNTRVRRVINDAGYRVAMWSVDPRDWQSPGSSVVASRVLSRARDGAVVVLHDGGGNRAGTVAAMRTVVPELQRRGFQLVTLSELTGLVEVPPVERGMRLTIGEETFEVEAGHDDVRVTVDGESVELTQPPVMIAGQFLTPARPVLNALGASVQWDPEALAVAFPGAGGEFVVRLNTLDVTLGDESLLVRTPSVFYHGTAMLPVWLMANARGAEVAWNSEERVVEFTTGPGVNEESDPPGEGMLTLGSFDGGWFCLRSAYSLLGMLPGGAKGTAG